MHNDNEKSITAPLIASTLCPVVADSRFVCPRFMTQRTPTLTHYGVENSTTRNNEAQVVRFSSATGLRALLDASVNTALRRLRDTLRIHTQVIRSDTKRQVKGCASARMQSKRFRLCVFFSNVYIN